jgi:hypothetical protein
MSNEKELKTNLIKASNRIKSIEWNVEWRTDEKLDWFVERLREFFRRSALWRDALENYDGEYWPLFDIGDYVDPSIKADKDIWRDLKNHLLSLKVGMETRMTCEWYLHWVALRMSGRLEIFDLPDPYEPLIEMYEAGSGIIYVEHIFVCLQGIMVPFYHYDKGRIVPFA